MDETSHREGASEGSVGPVDVAILTVIRPELIAALKALHINKTDRHKHPRTGSIYWMGKVWSSLTKRHYSLVLGCIGAAGNYNSAASATEIIQIFSPRALLLMGIAAGVRSKVKIGEVVLSERVVAYEPAAATLKEGQPTLEPRPEMQKLLHSMNQDVVAYQADSERIGKMLLEMGGHFPLPTAGREAEFQAHVASSIMVCDATIASGEKLLRDPGKLHAMRQELHGKIEVGEMEAAGLVEACRRGNVPWLVIRGISDFGDSFKDDRFHEFASMSSAAVLSDFITYGLDLGGSSNTNAPPPASGSKAPSVQAPQSNARAAGPRESYLKWRSEDVSNRLHTSIHHARFLDLGLTEALNSVKPWTYQVYEPNRPSVEFDSFDKVMFHYEGRVLLLGGPGSGKTTILLNQAKKFLDAAQKNSAAPIPFLFNLSQWDDDQESISDWLIRLMAQIRGAGVDTKTASKWVHGGEIVLLLDGLDELLSELRPKAISAINKYLADYPQVKVVICSRTEDYELIQIKSPQKSGKLALRLTGAAKLQPLTLSQIHTYLTAAQAVALRDFLPADADLQELARTPLTLSMMTLAYGDIATGSFRQQGTILERRTHLFDSYIDCMLQRTARRSSISQDPSLHTEDRNPKWNKPLRYTRTDMYRYLGWLGIRLSEQGKTVFPVKRIYQFLEEGAGSELFNVIGVTNAIASFLMSALLIYLSFLYPTAWKVGRVALIFFVLLAGVIGGTLSLFGRWVRVILSPRRPHTAARILHLAKGFIVTSALAAGFFFLITIGGEFVSILEPQRSPLIIVLEGTLVGTICGFILCITFIKGWPDEVVIGSTIAGLFFSGLALVGMRLDGRFPVVLVANLLAAFFGSAIGVVTIIRPSVDRGYAPGMYAVLALLGALVVEIADRSVYYLGVENRARVTGISLIVTFILVNLFRNRIYDIIKGSILNQIARLLLVINGYSPANYEKFLRHCVDAFLLKQAGLDYEFMHRLLRDHFAIREILPGLHDPKPRIRLRAVQRLARLGDAARDVLSSAQADTDPDVSRAARDTLTNLSTNKK